MFLDIPRFFVKGRFVLVPYRRSRSRIAIRPTDEVSAIGARFHAPQTPHTRHSPHTLAHTHRMNEVTHDMTYAHQYRLLFVSRNVCVCLSMFEHHANARTRRHRVQTVHVAMRRTR